MDQRQIDLIRSLYGQKGLGRGLEHLGYTGDVASTFDDATSADELQTIVEREVRRVESINARAQNAYSASLARSEEIVAGFDRARAEYAKRVLPKRAALVDKMIAALSEIDADGVFGDEIADFIRARATDELDAQPGEGDARRHLDLIRFNGEPKPYAYPEAHEYGDEKHVPNALDFLRAVIEVKRREKAAAREAFRKQMADAGMVM